MEVCGVELIQLNHIRTGPFMQSDCMQSKCDKTSWRGTCDQEEGAEENIRKEGQGRAGSARARGAVSTTTCS